MVVQAWDAVGVRAGCAPGVAGSDAVHDDRHGPEPGLRVASTRTSTTRDCTWTYTNPTAGFAFHFTALDTEKDYDYVYVAGRGGHQLATYTGTKHGKGFYGPCIPGTTGSVHLKSDAGVTAYGLQGRRGQALLT